MDVINAVTLDQLSILVTIADTGSFSAAGRKLGRVQSAISSAVQTLETVHQVRLFDRQGRTPRLTDAGRVLVAHARQVVGQAEQFRRVAGAIAAGLEPELNLAISTLVPTGPVLRALAGLQRTFPDLPVALYTESVGGAERRIADGTASLALCSLIPTMHPHLQLHRLATVSLVPVAAAEHPLAHARGPLTREVLANHVQLVLTDPTAAPGPSYSVVSPRIWRFVDILRRLEFLLAGFGWCTMPLHLVADHLAAGRLVRLALDDTGVLTEGLPVFAVHQRNRPPGQAARWLLDDLLRQEWPETAGLAAR
jgi:DNA-binding transcriptional LysR family regulator